MRTIRIHTAAAVVLIATFATGLVPASAQSAKQVLESAAQRYEQRMQGIENYTLVQDVMGMETTLYFEKVMVDGRPVFQIRSGRVAGHAIPVDDDAGMNDPYRHFPEFTERAKYGGAQVVGGKRTHSIIVDDFTGLDFNPSPVGDQQHGFAPRRMTMYLDVEDELLRRMEIEGDVTVGGNTAPVTTSIDFEDYRTTDGLLHYWKSTMLSEGLAEASGMSPEERANARKQLAEMEKQMESMPAAQRQMMERMMGGQLERLREMVETGNLEVVTQVTGIRVNQGAPR